MGCKGEAAGKGEHKQGTGPELRICVSKQHINKLRISIQSAAPFTYLKRCTGVRSDEKVGKLKVSS